MSEKPKVKIKRGGVGGRRTENKFGDNANSIQASLSFMPKEVQQRYRENKMRHDADASALERWAANDFESGYEVG